MVFVFRFSHWLAAREQPKHWWAGIISESIWIVTGPDPLPLLQPIYPLLCCEPMQWASRRSEGFFLGSSYCPWLGWRWGLPCSWQRWMLLSSARNETRVENYGPPWSDLDWKSGISWLLALVGGIFICGMPFLWEQGQSSCFHILAFSVLLYGALVRGREKIAEKMN